MNKTLYGERVYLRPILKSDLPNLNKWKNDESVYRYLGGGYSPISIDQHETWIEKLIDLSGNNKRFIISTQYNDTIGMVGLYDINWVNGTAEIGLFIGNTEHQKQGYAKESYQLIENYAKKVLNLRKIKLNVVESNESGFQLWLKQGFNVIGKLEDERYINGNYENVLIMEKFL